MTVRRLPKGYRTVAALDLMRDRKALVRVNALSMILLVVPLILGLWRHPFGASWALLKSHWEPWIAAAAMLVAYIPLHEAVHGVWMFALSRTMPRFGLKLPFYAWAGSSVWFGRNEHIAIALAPLLICGAGLFLLERAVPEAWFWVIYATQLSNLSGSAGDLYAVWYLSKYPKNALIQDTGVRMRVALPRPPRKESQP